MLLLSTRKPNGSLNCVRWLGKQGLEQGTEEGRCVVTSVFSVAGDMPVIRVMLKSINFVDKTSLEHLAPA